MTDGSVVSPAPGRKIRAPSTLGIESMNLAAVLGVCLLILFPSGMRASAQDQGSAPAAQAQTPPAPETAPPASAPQNSPAAAKPSPNTKKHHKKTSVPDCSTAPTPLSSPAGAAPGSTNTGSSNSDPVTAKPCPPPKVVVRNGGSDEPVVELKGNATTEQASQQRTTAEQLTAGTEENLKKIAGRTLSSSQQEMVSQIKQFMARSKKAVAAGDLERGRNLANKAHLLSEELVKP